MDGGCGGWIPPPLAPVPCTPAPSPVLLAVAAGGPGLAVARATGGGMEGRENGC